MQTHLLLLLSESDSNQPGADNMTQSVIHKALTALLQEPVSTDSSKSSRGRSITCCTSSPLSHTVRVVTTWCKLW
jgi:hypothetical protein